MNGSQLVFRASDHFGLGPAEMGPPCQAFLAMARPCIPWPGMAYLVNKLPSHVRHASSGKPSFTCPSQLMIGNAIALHRNTGSDSTIVRQTTPRYDRKMFSK